MPTRKKPATAEERARIVADIKRRAAERSEGYRDRALKLLPHVCGRCGKSFAGKDLKLLTVHHKDHNHDNNPADGSNWENLCLYCHDWEHQKYSALIKGEGAGFGVTGKNTKSATHNPFAGLKDILDKKT